MTLEDTRSEEVLLFIRGDGREAHLGVGISTYPMIDENHHRRYDRSATVSLTFVDSRRVYPPTSAAPSLGFHTLISLFGRGYPPQ